jgi:hypothetical protein
MSNQDSPTQEAPDVIQIDSVDQFVRILVAWHGERCAAVQHLLELPDGAEFQVGDNPPIVLTGDMLAGFKFGIEMVMMQLGTLPFTAELEDAPVGPIQ